MSAVNSLSGAEHQKVTRKERIGCEVQVCRSQVKNSEENTLQQLSTRVFMPIVLFSNYLYCKHER